ncbi:hypothetical protein AB4Z54_12705, partial [Streptomyces sp. MCAF7]
MRKTAVAVAAIVVGLGVVAAVLMSGGVMSDDGDKPKARAGGSTSPSQSTSPSPSPSLSPGSASSTRTADTAGEPALLTGECTDVFHDGSAWYPADQAPGPVDCAADDAYYRV